MTLLTAEQIERIFIDLKEFAWDMFRVSPDDSIRNLTKAEAHAILDELCRRSLQIPEEPTGWMRCGKCGLRFGDDKGKIISCPKCESDSWKTAHDELFDQLSESRAMLSR